MAVKKIKLDFSKVEERSGWNTRAMPEGLHKMKVASVQETSAQDGTDMLVFSLVPVDPKYKSRNFPFYCKLQQNQLWKLRDLLVATGSTVPKRAGMIDPNAPVGKFIAAEVEDETGQYAGRSSVNGTYGLEILDEDGDGAEPDEEDEEYEEDEEAEEEADDEEEDDLETMTLPDLRKLAKSLGVDTVGLKKDELIEAIEEAEDEADDEAEDEDEDEDDLDDEELDDDELYEDDEEEEEETEPAPKRRAPAKPAAKPAAARAKAAPAAAARRTVKRR